MSRPWLDAYQILLVCAAICWYLPYYSIYSAEEGDVVSGWASWPGGAEAFTVQFENGETCQYATGRHWDARQLEGTRTSSRRSRADGRPTRHWQPGIAAVDTSITKLGARSSFTLQPETTVGV
jgi:hypothetical protein